MNTKQYITHNLLSIPGFRTNRHIIVIESDDWGSIRMPSLETYNKLVNKGVKFGRYGYDKIDTIASRDDLEKLFEVCDSFKDINGNPVKITANAVVANPDFQKIKESNFTEYFYEPITTTMEHYYPGKSPFALWKEGMEKKVFHPQLHGREHVNVPMWMNSLKQNFPGVRDAFEFGVFSILVDSSFDIRIKNTNSLDYISLAELPIVKQSIKEGCVLFKELFGYKSKSFIAPAYTWDEEIECLLSSLEVKFLQGLSVHSSRYGRSITYIGKSNKYGQYYLQRNANFEYSQNPNFDWNGDAMKNIQIAFRWGKPATISTHRINFVGGLNQNNRDKNLIKFKELITSIQKQWPDVEFMSSDELGNLIANDK